MENNLPHFITLREFTIVRQLLKKEPQLKDLSVHSSILAWRIPWTEEPGGLQSTGSQRVTHDFTFTFTFCLVQPLSHVWLCYTMHCRMPGFPVHHQLPEPAQTHVHWVDAIQPSHPLLTPSPPTFNLSQHQSIFHWAGSSHQVAKVSELQLQQQSFQWIFRIDFFRIDWFELLAVQGTLKSLLQHHSSKASILQHSALPWEKPKNHWALLRCPTCQADSI